MRRRRGSFTVVLSLVVLLGVLLGVPRDPVILVALPEIHASCSSGPDDAPVSGFRSAQVRYPRVRDAYREKEGPLRRLFSEKGVPFPPGGVFLRLFKREQQLELWAGPGGRAPLTLVRVYPVCATSGELGPKRRQGDGQVPEGFYRIDHWNPESQFHLSLRVDYPNRADRLRETHGRPGGDIYVHGSCVTIGCVPIGDDAIKELYVVAVEARAAGQPTLPIHLFPTRLDAAGLGYLDRLAGGDRALREFWHG